ncbi:deflagellation inducible [Chlorella sorokiniana]|uniref:Deflagellation inducible n=1 Tax=Chlorella sorokiniana TaxID=3076 RepID=A0A2P6U118_CHLSO|nr:deflagellation inducible [Chlorella sorokiniana]|eukprot:PRW60002.1 deflagellation inducible [Chlorella sorokiniana]
MEELQQRRAELLVSTREEEAERARVAQDLAALQRRLGQLDASIERKRAGREALERVISQAQAALDKLAESSGLCLAVTRRNAQEALALAGPDLRDAAA